MNRACKECGVVQPVSDFPKAGIVKGVQYYRHKWLRKKQKLNPTSLEESSRTLRQTPSQDLVSDSYAAYREAAKSDDYMFGNYDAYKAYEEYGDIPD